MAVTAGEFQVFVKPVGAKCNLGCRYCYYLGKEKVCGPDSTFPMSEEILERYISSHIKNSDGETVFFSWHGGEPTLAGIGFFEKALEIQKKHCPPDIKIINGLQTNATLLDDKWCSFFARENFFVGVSIDGNEKLHNRFRLSKDGKGSFSRTIRGYGLLQKHNVSTEILAVVNSENVQFPLEVYRFLKSLGTGFITFIPLVERDRRTVSGASAASVPAAAFGKFLCEIFDEWVEKDIGKVKIQIIEEALRTAFRQDHTLCIFKRICGGVPVIEHNGDFYSCDHFVDRDHYISNIRFITLDEMLGSKTQQDFGMAKLTTLPRYCLECRVRDMCNGECPKNRFIETPSGEPGLNYLCEGYKKFFSHIGPFADAVSEEFRRKG
jgi:uncharacterized protein